MPFSAVVFIVILVVFSLSIIHISEMKSKKTYDNNAFGDAKVLTKKDLLNEIKHKKIDAYKRVKPIKNEEPKKGGFIVSSDEKDIIFDAEQKHELLVAGTGAGKTTTKIIPSLMTIAESKAKETMILSDVKGELYEKTNNYLKELGYTTILLNFSNPRFGEQLNQLEACNTYMCTSLNAMYKYKAIHYLLEELKKESFQLNPKKKLKQMNKKYTNEYKKAKNELKNNDKKINEPLAYKRMRVAKEIVCYLNSFSFDDIEEVKEQLNEEAIKEKNIAQNYEEEAQKQALSIANMIMSADKKGESKGEAIWENSAEMLITSLIMLIVRESINEKQKHLGSVYRFLMEYNQYHTEEELQGKTFLDTLISSYDKLDAISATYSLINSATSNTKTSMIVSGISPMRIFGYNSVISQASGTSFQLHDLIDKPMAIFLYTPGKDTVESKAYTMLCSLAIEQLYSYLKSVAETLPNKTLPRRINFLLDEVANIPRLQELGSKVSLARSYNIRFMLVIQEIAQLEQLYGKNETKNIIANCNLVYMKTSSEETTSRISKMCGKETVTYQNQSFSKGKSGDSSSESTSSTGKDLFSVDKLLRFKTGECLFLQSGRNPIHTNLIGYWKIPNWSAKLEKAGASPLQTTPRSLLENDYFLPEYEDLKTSIIKMRDNTLFSSTENEEIIEEPIRTNHRPKTEEEKEIMNFYTKMLEDKTEMNLIEDVAQKNYEEAVDTLNSDDIFDILENISA